MSNDKANAAYHGRTERPTFPEDALTANERKTLARLDDEATRHGWSGAPRSDEWATPMPATEHAATSRYTDGPAVKPTLANFGAMLLGGAVLIAIAGGVILELALLF